jgi:RNA polymerase sigma-70 factor (ECF subfamily)
MLSPDQPRDLVALLREGEPRAVEAFQGYAVRLARLAEQHLSQKVAARLDGEDVVQSVFRTFFRRCSQGEFQIDTSAQIWRLLVTLTLRKARAHARRHLAGKRDAAVGLCDADCREVKRGR